VPVQHRARHEKGARAVCPSLASMTTRLSAVAVIVFGAAVAEPSLPAGQGRRAVAVPVLSAAPTASSEPAARMGLLDSAGTTAPVARMVGSTWCANESLCHFPTSAPEMTSTLRTTVTRTTTTICCQRFFKCAGSERVYYQNGLSPVKHLLHDGACPTCVEPSMCARVLVFDDTYCDTLNTGENFDCGMVLCHMTTTTTMPIAMPAAMPNRAWSWWQYAILAALTVACSTGMAVAVVWCCIPEVPKVKHGKHGKRGAPGPPGPPGPPGGSVVVPVPLSPPPTTQGYDLLTVTPDGYDVRPGSEVAVAFPPPLAPQSPAPAVQPMQPQSVARAQPMVQPLSTIQPQSTIQPPAAMQQSLAPPMPALSQVSPVGEAAPAYDIVTLTPQGYEIRPM